MADVKGGQRPTEPEFARALTLLASDEGYRERATSDPEIIERDFKLTLEELESLRKAAILSGNDVTAVNRLRAERITATATGQLTAATTDISISCCSCCCCCCGETAVVPVH